MDRAAGEMPPGWAHGPKAVRRIAESAARIRAAWPNLSGVEVRGVDLGRFELERIPTKIEGVELGMLRGPRTFRACCNCGYVGGPMVLERVAIADLVKHFARQHRRGAAELSDP